MKLLKNSGVTCYGKGHDIHVRALVAWCMWCSEGKGRLLDAHTVRIALSAGGEQTITANRILLATGNKAVKLDIPGKVLSLQERGTGILR